MEMNRRVFMKTVGAAALAVAATGLLGGCGDGALVAGASGLNNTAELKGIKMKVCALRYKSNSDGTFSLMPEISIENQSAAGVPVSPSNGSFKIVANGSKELTVNADTMSTLEGDTGMKAIETRTLNRGQSTKGYVCGKGTSQIKLESVEVVFYPNAQDTKTYLVCKVRAGEGSLIL